LAEGFTPGSGFAAGAFAAAGFGASGVFGAAILGAGVFSAGLGFIADVNFFPVAGLGGDLKF
jgi:hypothetical protein